MQKLTAHRSCLHNTHSTVHKIIPGTEAGINNTKPVKTAKLEMLLPGKGSGTMQKKQLKLPQRYQQGCQRRIDQVGKSSRGH